MWANLTSCFDSSLVGLIPFVTQTHEKTQNRVKRLVTAGQTDQHQPKPQPFSASAAATPATSTATGFGAGAAAAPASAGLDSVLAEMRGHEAISTVAKSSYDWDSFKAEKGLDNELAQATKDGWVVDWVVVLCWSVSVPPRIC
jgi:hypothetical protein